MTLPYWMMPEPPEHWTDKEPDSKPLPEEGDFVITPDGDVPLQVVDITDGEIVAQDMGGNESRIPIESDYDNLGKDLPL
jgi:hypothetical protein